jgi:cytochrome c
MSHRYATSTLIGTLALCALALPASADEAFAKAKGCLNCHSVQAKVIGPAYKDVAAKYKGDKDAAAKLETSVLKGSSGKWGPIPMPANPVTEADAKQLVAWVLSLK